MGWIVAKYYAKLYLRGFFAMLNVLIKTHNYSRGVNHTFYHNMMLHVFFGQWYDICQYHKVCHNMILIQFEFRALWSVSDNIMCPFNTINHIYVNNKKQPSYDSTILYDLTLRHLWHRHGSFKIKVCLKDDYIDRYFHFASIILDHCVLRWYIDPDLCILSVRSPEVFPRSSPCLKHGSVVMKPRKKPLDLVLKKFWKGNLDTPSWCPVKVAAFVCTSEWTMQKWDKRQQLKAAFPLQYSLSREPGALI